MIMYLDSSLTWTEMLTVPVTLRCSMLGVRKMSYVLHQARQRQDGERQSANQLSRQTRGERRAKGNVFKDSHEVQWFEAGDPHPKVPLSALNSVHTHTHTHTHTHKSPSSQEIRESAGVRVCVCACSPSQPHSHTHARTLTHSHTHTLSLSAQVST